MHRNLRLGWNPVKRIRTSVVSSFLCFFRVNKIPQHSHFFRPEKTGVADPPDSRVGPGWSSKTTADPADSAVAEVPVKSRLLAPSLGPDGRTVVSSGPKLALKGSVLYSSQVPFGHF